MSLEKIFLPVAGKCVRSTPSRRKQTVYAFRQKRDSHRNPTPKCRNFSSLTGENRGVAQFLARLLRDNFIRLDDLIRFLPGLVGGRQGREEVGWEVEPELLPMDGADIHLIPLDCLVFIVFDLESLYVGIQLHGLGG